MAQYRKRPVVIEAVQFKPGENDSELTTFLQWCAGWYTLNPVDGTTTRSIVIPTLEGDHTASPGDWIIKGVKGEFYPCKDDIFRATYERVDGTPV
jgi:hypothetical protein